MIHARSDYDHIQDPTGKIAEDEPVFLLRAKDETAPMAVRQWALMQYDHINGDRYAADAAMRQATRMEEWQKANGSQLPDAPRETLR
jgi:hypothetical protein